MQTKLTLYQRLVAETPAFFKRAQLFGLGLAGLGTSLSSVAGMPDKLGTVLISVGTTIAVVSQFAVTQLLPDGSSEPRSTKNPNDDNL